MELAITITINFVGALRELTGKNAVSLKIGVSAIVKDVISELSNYFQSEFRQVVTDPELADPWSNVLILVNKKEIGVLDGLRTRVENGDELILIPISHGG